MAKAIQTAGGHVVGGIKWWVANRHIEDAGANILLASMQTRSLAGLRRQLKAIFQMRAPILYMSDRGCQRLALDLQNPWALPPSALCIAALPAHHF